MVFRTIKRAALFLLLLCLGCSAQSTAPTELERRVERLVRSHYTVAPTVNVKVTGRQASSEFPSYDEITVTLSRGERSTALKFLLSKDGKKLFQLTPLEDPMEKIDLAGRPWRGNPDAKVVLVNYDDFQCPFCSRNHQDLMQGILKQYGDRIRIVYKDYPLDEIHGWARRAAVNANCLAQQNNDAYWDFADYVHANQREITGAQRAPEKATPEQQAAFSTKVVQDQFARLDSVAGDIGRRRNLDTGKLQACLKAQNDEPVKDSKKEAESLGVSATPTMFVNGEKLDGAVPPEQLRIVLDRALRDAGQQAPAPATPGGAAANPSH